MTGGSVTARHHPGRKDRRSAPRLKTATTACTGEVSSTGRTADALAGLDGVAEAYRTGDKWRIVTEDPDLVIRSLVAFSGDCSAAILTLNTLAPSLDEVFLRLTGEEQP